MDIETLKYPIGKPNFPNIIEQEHINAWIQDIKQFPSLVTKEANDAPG